MRARRETSCLATLSEPVRAGGPSTASQHAHDSSASTARTVVGDRTKLPPRQNGARVFSCISVMTRKQRRPRFMRPFRLAGILALGFAHHSAIAQRFTGGEKLT